MEFKKNYSWGAALIAAAIVTFVAMPFASAELLYDEDLEAQQQAGASATQTRPDPRVDDRGDLRRALGASHRATTTVQAQPSVSAAPSPVQILQPENAQISVSQATATSTAAPAADADVQNMSKAELMRRERVREEVKNEDILQERLEELRLRDERRRTDELLQAKAAQQNTAVASATMSQEVIGNAQPVVHQPVVYSNEPAPGATLTATAASAAASDDEKTRLWVQPHVGISQMTTKDWFEVVPHYSAGVSGGAEVSDNLAFEIGYMFNEYGVKTAANMQYAYQGANFETHAMKQNVFEGGLKLYFLDASAKLRPFIGAGAAYTLSYVNYPETMLNYYRMSGRYDLAQDYQSTSYVGSLSTGFDVRVNKSIAVGAQFKYYRVLSAHENQDLATGYYGYGMMPADPQKNFVGSSLSVSSFYSILAGATFSF